MTQVTSSIRFTDTQLQAIDTALSELETQTAALIALDVSQRRALTKMGEKSEAFCRQAISLLAQNPQLVPPSIVVADAQSTLSTLDQLRPRMQRLLRLGERVADTDMALGAELMTTSLQGYALLKVSGKNQGLDGLRDSLGARFSRRPRQETPKAA